MIIDKDTVIINGLNMGPFIVEAKTGFHKIWGNDTGRTLSGAWGGTLKGIFPKITLQYAKLTRSQAETLAPIFDSAIQTVKYYDPNKKRKITMTTYSNDWELTSKNIVDEVQKTEGLSVAFISTKKRV